MKIRGNRGQAVVLYVVALPALLAILALALDGGKMFVTKVHVQNAADAAALASAQDLADCSTGDGPPPAGSCDLVTVRAQVETDVNNYSLKNGGPAALAQCAGAWYAENQAQRNLDPVHDSSHVTGCYTWPYVKNSPSSDLNCRPSAGSTWTCWDQVEVRIRKPIQLQFAGVVGFTNPAYAFARSVGKLTPLTATTSSGDVPVPEVVDAGQTHTTTTVIDGTTYTTTTVIAGGTHTTTTPASTVTNTTTTSTFSGGTGGAAFLKSTDCAPDAGGAALHWSGADSTLRSIIVNGGIDIPGANTHTSDKIWVGKKGTANCVILGSGARIGQISGPFTPLDWPLAPPNPAPPAGCLNTDTGSISGGWTASHPSGVYCWTSGTLQISANGATFNGYSFFAPSISISSNGMIFNPSLSCGTRKVLFDAYAGDFTMNGGGDTLNGDIYAPNGNISVTGGGSFAGCGYMEALKMNVGGNFAGYSGTGPGDGGGVVTVVRTTTTVIPASTQTTTDPDETTYSTSVSGGTTSFSYTTDPSTTVVFATTIPGTTATITTSTVSGLGE